MAETFELDERERVLLAAACRQADAVAALEAVVTAEGPMSVGSTGQPVLHPAVAEARAGRLALARLLGQLDLPAAGLEDGGSIRSQRARRAAQIRWHGGAA